MRRLAALVVILLGGCSTGVCGCSPIDPTATVVVDGTVLDSAGAPVASVEVSPLGVLAFDCSVDTSPVTAEPTPAVSGADGRFAMLLWNFDSAGRHCVDFLVRVPTTGHTDTIPNVQAQFRTLGERPDTVTLSVTVGN